MLDYTTTECISSYKLNLTVLTNYISPFWPFLVSVLLGLFVKGCAFLGDSFKIWFFWWILKTFRFGLTGSMYLRLLIWPYHVDPTGLYWTRIIKRAIFYRSVIFLTFDFIDFLFQNCIFRKMIELCIKSYFLSFSRIWTKNTNKAIKNSFTLSNRTIPIQIS